MSHRVSNMGIKKIAFIQLDQLVRSGKSVSEIARQLNVTKGAVSKALKRLNVAVTKDVALRAAPKKRRCSTRSWSIFPRSFVQKY